MKHLISDDLVYIRTFIRSNFGVDHPLYETMRILASEDKKVSSTADLGARSLREDFGMIFNASLGFWTCTKCTSYVGGHNPRAHLRKMHRDLFPEVHIDQETLIQLQALLAPHTEMMPQVYGRLQAELTDVTKHNVQVYVAIGDMHVQAIVKLFYEQNEQGTWVCKLCGEGYLGTGRNHLRNKHLDVIDLETA